MPPKHEFGIRVLIWFVAAFAVFVAMMLAAMLLGWWR
jgi:hypothetical protein